MSGISRTENYDTGIVTFQGFWHTRADNVDRRTGECDNPRCGCHAYFAEKRGEPMAERWVVRL